MVFWLTSPIGKIYLLPSLVQCWTYCANWDGNECLICSSWYVWCVFGLVFVLSMITVMFCRYWKGSLVKDQAENSKCIEILCKNVFKLLLKWQGCQVFLLVLSWWSLESGLINRKKIKKLSNMLALNFMVFQFMNMCIEE